MTVSVSLLATAVVLCAVGGILMLTRPLTRILLGAVIASNGINLLILAATGSAGEEPLLYGVQLGRVTDPLPQAIALTAIVITLATTAFLLAMAYRGHQLTGTDEVHDDLEDRRIALRAEVLGERDELRERYRAADDVTDEQRARYREERRRLRARLRADRALQARGRYATGNLWHDVLGADPEDYPQPSTADTGPGPRRTGTDPPEDPRSGNAPRPGNDLHSGNAPRPEDAPRPRNGPRPEDAPHSEDTPRERPPEAPHPHDADPGATG
ncbi:Na(+)/H(+) antiporter subunit C [Streptomyces sp. ML-6]|uniref:Na(+)/H(+) antiporter subunit C n=1 Tax=Streptomyces sp. ML-6 TaxID=2982693 RepID=UPI0024C07A24|nr:Na(+)/H(+) antiporter subunit C [Streptomyces sp. ML-6]MDK0522833.1 Na(+)/H(+) antiporter subunit C [Streptomyces sp. ML-6]